VPDQDLAADSLAPLLTVHEAAAILKVNPRTMWRLIKDERLAVIHVGRLVRIRREALAALIRGE
jgi:excisionase family DNA binding protein